MTRWIQLLLVVFLLAMPTIAYAGDPTQPSDDGVWVPPVPISGENGGIENLSYVNRLQGTIITPPRHIPDFTLSSTDGADFTLSDYRGELVMVYFGYLACPDVCPTTMADLLRAYREIGEPDDVNVVFITIDPERDNLEIMDRYISAFHDNFVALRPTQEQLDDLVEDFGVIYERREVDSALEYLMDHSASVFMLGTDGKLINQFPFGVPYTEMANDMSVMLEYSLDADVVLDTTVVPHDEEREYRIFIPEGTGSEIALGNDPGIIPLEINLTLGERDILVLENHDMQDYLVGGIWVAPYETAYKQFYTAQTFVGLCTVTVGRDLVEIIVVEPTE